MDIELVDAKRSGQEPTKFRYGAPAEWPTFTGSADQVGVFLRINQVDTVDLTKQEIKLTGSLDLFWRCTGSYTFPQCLDFTIVDDEDVPEGDPQPQWATAQEMNLLSKFTYVVPSKGYLVTEHQFKSTFVDPIDARAFPFDWQDFTIAIGMRPGKGGGDRRYVMLMDPVIFTTNQAIPEWQIYGKGEAPGTAIMNGGKMKTMFCKFGDGSGHLARCWFRFHMRRYPYYYIVNVFALTMMISTLSVCSFAIPFTDIADRLSFNVTLLLTLVALKFVVSGFMPKVPYMTMMDIRLNLSGFVLLVVMLIQSSAVHFNFYGNDLDPWVGGVYTASLLLIEFALGIKCCCLAFFKPKEDWEGGAPVVPVP